jgi:hypothetical protein
MVVISSERYQFYFVEIPHIQAINLSAKEQLDIEQDRPELNGWVIESDKSPVIAGEELVDDERRENMLVSALEGGSNYWYWLPEAATAIIRKHKERGEPLSTGMWKAIKAGETIPVHDAEDEEEKLGEINLESIKKGEALMLKQHARHFADLVSENSDATTADVWFQLCTLGEVTYG